MRWSVGRIDELALGGGGGGEGGSYIVEFAELYFRPLSQVSSQKIA